MLFIGWLHYSFGQWNTPRRGNISLIWGWYNPREGCCHVSASECSQCNAMYTILSKQWTSLVKAILSYLKREKLLYDTPFHRYIDGYIAGYIPAGLINPWLHVINSILQLFQLFYRLANFMSAWWYKAFQYQNPTSFPYLVFANNSMLLAIYHVYRWSIEWNTAQLPLWCDWRTIKF